MLHALEKIVDDVKESTGNALRLSSLAAAAGAALLVTGGFLTAALFVFVQERHGTLAACLAGAGAFFVVALMAIGTYVAHKRRIARLLREAEERAARAAAAAPQSPMFDPAMIAIGIQVLRAVGFKRLVPILAIGGVAAGFFAAQRNAGSRRPRAAAPEPPTEP